MILWRLLKRICKGYWKMVRTPLTEEEKAEMQAYQP